jgi:hypothetical protein
MAATRDSDYYFDDGNTVFEAESTLSKVRDCDRFDVLIADKRRSLRYIGRLWPGALDYHSRKRSRSAAGIRRGTEERYPSYVAPISFPSI